jgi:hypothetical protein
VSDVIFPICQTPRLNLFCYVVFWSVIIVDKKASDALARKELIEKQFSLWDGSHKNLKDLIKRAMNDPDSHPCRARPALHH